MRHQHHAKNELLRCQKKLARIRKGYKRSLKTAKVSLNLRAEVKEFVAGLMSTLDYVAGDIYHYLTKSKNLPKWKGYFPIGINPSDFAESVKKNLTGLETEFPKVYTILESFQAFSTYSWIKLLSELSNESKHRNYPTHSRMAAMESYGPKKGPVRMRISGASMALGPNANFDLDGVELKTTSLQMADGASLKYKGKPIQFDAESGLPFPGQGIWAKIEWQGVYLNINGVSVEAFPFLESSMKKCEQICNDVYPLLP